ncbi:MAG: InlB B-repeat-containing protein, partial [Anaeroplasmataceae bacterium]|nr:InlB B-repeat-containing protein [Anaeroplasmataceae bacterium]
ATLNKEDLFVLLDHVSYVLELIKGNAIHFEIADASLDITINNQVESISVNGSIDLLWNEEGYQVVGSLLVDGAGIVAQISLILVDNTIYLTMSNQTFSLKLNEIDDFIAEAIEILSPMVSLDMPSMDNSNFELNLKDLGFILTSESIGASLEAIVGKACTLLVSFSLVENGLNTLVNVSYDELIHLEAPILISASEVEEIQLPSNALSKDDLLEILTYVVEAYELSLKDEFNLSISTSIHTNGEVVATIEGNVYIKLLENQEFDAHLSLIVHEYKDNSQIGWHQLDVQVISLTTMNTLDSSVGMAMFYAIYGNNPDDLNAVIKVKSTYTGIEDLIQKVLQLMNLEIPSLSSSANTSTMDIRSLIDYIHVEKNSLSLGIEANFLFASMLDERQIMHITLTKNQDSKLTGIFADNIYVSYTNTMKYTKLDALEVTLEEGQMEFDVPSAEALQEYYDISEISNLFEALYHNALERTFSISGNVVLKAKVLFTITESIPVKIKVGVEENGEPTVHVHIDMNNLKAGAILASKKTVDIYYYKNYVYIQRTESSSVKRVKVHINEFMDNLVYYLLDFGMGLSDTILKAIEKPVEGDGFVDAAKCINSINIQKDIFEFGLNMGELADNFNLEDLFISLGTSMVYQKNSDGSISLVPMIHRINNFEFKMVKVITLSSTDLVLDNIDKEGIYNAIDVSFIEFFTEEYNKELDNEGNPLQSDIIYELKNGVWVKASSIEHKVTFDLATSNTKLENQTIAYAKDDIILPPSLEELLEVTLEDGTVKYYEFKGWYLDASYLTLASEEDWIMQDKNRTFYAKYQDITSTVTIESPYHEDIILTSYIGFDISNYLSIYDLASADGKMYRFEGFSYAYDTILEKEVILETVWNEVQFYLIDNQNSYLLSTEDSSSFLSNIYYVPANINLGSSTSTIYYGYPGAVLTPSYILNMFSSSFVYNGTTNHLELEVFQTISNAYISTLIDDSLSIMGYILSSELEAKGIPLEQVAGYEINAWVDSYGNYYSWFDILAKSNQNVSYTDFYISTPQKDLIFEINDTAKITGFTFDTTVTKLITPRYVYHDGKASLVTVIGASAFFGAEETGKLFNKQTVYHHKLETIILHEGLVEIATNAFKNSNMLKAVYLPSTLTNVATDAFYMDVVSKAETNQGYAKNVKFHMLPNSTLNVGDWLAYKWNLTKHNYNSNNVPNSIVEETKSIVESVYTILSI